MKTTKDERPPHVTVFLRDEGVICYEAPIFGYGPLTYLEALTERLLSSGLQWFWESSPAMRDGKNPMFADSLPGRAVTSLTKESANTFISELLEWNDDGYGRSFLAFGIDSDASMRLLEPASFQWIIEQFAVHETGPLRIVLYQDGDSPFDYAFVPHEPIEQVHYLLEDWDISKNTIRKTRPYSELYTIRLESLLNR